MNGLPIKSILELIVQIKVLLVEVAGLILFVVTLVRIVKREMRR